MKRWMGKYVSHFSVIPAKISRGTRVYLQWYWSPVLRVLLVTVTGAEVANPPPSDARFALWHLGRLSRLRGQVPGDQQIIGLIMVSS